MADFSRFLTTTPTTPLDPDLAFDPINLVFYGNARLDNVVSILKNPALSIWRPAVKGVPVWNDHRGPFQPTTRMWCELDNSAVGGWKGCKPADRDLFIGPYYRANRMHIRLYSPTDPFHPTVDPLPDGHFGVWCIASVHREHWLPPGLHVVHGWMEARTFVTEWFSHVADGDGPRVLSITTLAVQNEGWYQGYWHDGNAAFIQLG